MSARVRIHTWSFDSLCRCSRHKLVVALYRLMKSRRTPHRQRAAIARVLVVAEHVRTDDLGAVLYLARNRGTAEEVESAARTALVWALYDKMHNVRPARIVA